MALTLEQKKAVVAEVAGVAQQAHAAVAAEYSGLSVGEMMKLREHARGANVYLRVVRNTLARRALADTDFACMGDRLVGPLVLAFSKEEPSSAARVIRDFAKENDKLIIRLVSFGGRLLEGSDIEVLASLPTMDEARARLLSVMMAPASKLVRTIAEPRNRLVRTLAAVRDKRQAT